MADEKILPRDLAVNPEPPTSSRAILDDGVNVFSSTITEIGNQIGAVRSIQEGLGISVNNTDPLNPIVTATEGGGDMFSAVYDPQGISNDAFARENHTGEQPISATTGLQDSLDEKTTLPIVKDEYGVPPFNTVSDLLSDDNNRIGYEGSGADFIVPPGGIIEAQGFRYEVSAGDATDSHVETAGGVKLRVLGKDVYVSSLGQGNDDTFIKALMATPEGGRTILDIDVLWDAAEFVENTGRDYRIISTNESEINFNNKDGGYIFTLSGGLFLDGVSFKNTRDLFYLSNNVDIIGYEFRKCKFYNISNCFVGEDSPLRNSVGYIKAHENSFEFIHRNCVNLNQTYVEKIEVTNNSCLTLGQRGFRFYPTGNGSPFQGTAYCEISGNVIQDVNRLRVSPFSDSEAGDAIGVLTGHYSSVVTGNVFKDFTGRELREGRDGKTAGYQARCTHEVVEFNLFEGIEAQEGNIVGVNPNVTFIIRGNKFISTMSSQDVQSAPDDTYRPVAISQAFPRSLIIDGNLFFGNFYSYIKKKDGPSSEMTIGDVKIVNNHFKNCYAGTSSTFAAIRGTIGSTVVFSNNTIENFYGQGVFGGSPRVFTFEHFRDYKITDNSFKNIQRVDASFNEIQNGTALVLVALGEASSRISGNQVISANLGRLQEGDVFKTVIHTENIYGAGAGAISLGTTPTNYVDENNVME